ncbi:aldo/keto reductase [candidate division KSB1 bacterium]|nr:aldo/keto reductase [candidate division KSB1 bacterium]
MKRRDFLKHAGLVGGTIAMNPFPHHLFAAEIKKFAYDQVALGNTGIMVSRLAMGTGTHGINKSSNQTRGLGLQGVADLLHAAYDEGVNFWDSADQYGTHSHLKQTLTQVPREKVVILTKTHATTENEMKADLDRFLKELNTDYIDIMLLHFQTDPNWPTVKQGAMDVLSRAREDGIIRAHGVSCHSLGALEAAADSDWVQVDLARINPAGVIMDADVPTVEKVLNRMKKSGKSVIGMKVFGAGRLVHKADESLQYVMNQGSVDAFTSGQENQAEMRDLLKRIPAASVRD